MRALGRDDLRFKYISCFIAAYDPQLRGVHRSLGRVRCICHGQVRFLIDTFHVAIAPAGTIDTVLCDQSTIRLFRTKEFRACLISSNTDSQNVGRPTGTKPESSFANSLQQGRTEKLWSTTRASPYVGHLQRLTLSAPTFASEAFYPID